MRTSTLIYTSQSTQAVTDASLQAIAGVSTRNNAKVGVTGLLLYGSGHFLQVLEGNSFTIKQLYTKICQDARHEQCELLYENEREGRLFPKWHMGALNLEHSAEGQGTGWDLISATLAMSGAVDWQDTDPVLGWVHQFMDHNAGCSAA